jgi:hypothetical protein
VPVEYPQLRDLDEWEQIAGQAHYLERYLERELEKVGEDAVVRVTYEQLVREPADVLEEVAIRTGARIAQQPPESFPFRTHDGRDEEKQRFAALLDRF